MKAKLNMVGNSILTNVPEVCSSPLNNPRYIEWVTDGSSQISVHVDHALKRPTDKSKKNYGWFAESSTMIQGLIDEVFANLDYYKSNFECIFTFDKRVCQRDPFFKFTIPNANPMIQNRKIYDKTKKVSAVMSSNHDKPEYQYRLNCLGKIKSKDRDNVVDVYGRGRGQNELPWLYQFEGKRESGKMIALKDYRFSFAFENNNYPTMFCEKLTDCFATGTIPIFWGAPDIGDYFDMDGVIMYNDDIDLDSLTEELYMSKLPAIKRNFELTLEFLSMEDYFYITYIK